jgi:RNA polymerase sigma factor (sigma-70 family)
MTAPPGLPVLLPPTAATITTPHPCYRLGMPMKDSDLHQLQGLLETLRAGDQSASDPLFRMAYNQLAVIVRRKKVDFPGLDRWEGTGDILQETALRLHQAVIKNPPESVVIFFGLAARITRCVLIDRLRHYYGPQGDGANHATQGDDRSGSDTSRPKLEKSDGTYDPAPLAEMTDLHRQIDELDEEERQVVDLLVYQDLTTSQAAKLLDCSERTVKRRWASARLHLSAKLQK